MSAARIDFLISGLSGLVIALGMPAAMSIAMKLALIASRSGRPKETLLAPQVVLHPSSSLIQRTSWITAPPEPRIAPAGITSGSIRMSSGGMP